MWVAYLNLEYKYGDMASLDAVFARAVAESKAKYLYLALANTYEEGNNVEGALSLMERALKKHKASKKVWMHYHALCIRFKRDAKAKELLARSLQSLSRHKHIEVISKYALQEFEHGSIDRGRVLFEELLTNYPKRSDLWHIYVDREIKLGNVPQARQLFDRMIASKLSARNMKGVFKKYLQFESKHGSEDGVERVKSAAKEYVANLM